MTSDAAELVRLSENAIAMLYDSMSDQAVYAAARALSNAIRASSNADELEKLLEQPYAAELFANGLGSLRLWPSVIDAMVTLADTLPVGEEAARVLGWARWACSASPVDLVRPNVASSLVPRHREACLPAFEARISVYRRWLNDVSSERRAAGAHALAWCRDATNEDLGRLVVDVATETDQRTVGSALLTIGVLARRQGASSEVEAARSRAHERLASHDAFARAGAAIAQALMDGTISQDATAALLELVTNRLALPVGWGWRTAARIAYESDALACAVLGWVDAAGGDAAVRVLGSAEPGRNSSAEALLSGVLEHLGADAARDLARAQPSRSGVAEMFRAEALVHLAFEARARAPRPYGLVASELDPTERRAIEALAHMPQSAAALRRIGLYADPRTEAVSDFLRATKLEWRPIAVRVDGVERHWHFGALWGATVLGCVEVSDACDAILATMAPSEAVDLVTRFTDGRMPAYERIESASAWVRDQELSLLVIDASVARGFDLDEMMKAVAQNRRSGLPAIAAVAYLRAHPDHVPPEHWAIIEDGVAQARVKEPLQSLAAAWRAVAGRG